jgi:hypothetical protein
VLFPSHSDNSVNPPSDERFKVHQLDSTAEIVDFTGQQSYCVWHENTEYRRVSAPETTCEPLLVLPK